MSFCFITEKDFATHSGLSNLQDPDHKHSNLFSFCTFFRFFTLRAMYEVNRSPRPPLSLFAKECRTPFSTAVTFAHSPNWFCGRRGKDDETTRRIERRGQPKKVLRRPVDRLKTKAEVHSCFSDIAKSARQLCDLWLRPKCGSVFKLSSHGACQLLRTSADKNRYRAG